MFSDKYVFFHLTEITLQYLIVIYKYYDTQIRFRFFPPFLITVKAIHSFSFIYCIHLFIEIKSGARVFVSRITARGNNSDISTKDLLEERCLGFLRDATDPPPGAAERKEQGRRDARRRRCEKRPAKGQDAARGSSRRSLANWRRMRRMHVCRRHGWP